MATLTVFGDAGDGAIESSSAVYLTARAGSGLIANDTGTTFSWYQEESGGSFGFQEMFIGFDTSPLGVTAMVSAATLSLFDANVFSNNNSFIMQARLHDWGAVLTTADFVAGADLATKTLLATLADSSRVAGAYNDLDNVAMPANINVTAFTRMVVCDDLMETGAQPGVGTTERWRFSAADEAGTTQDPKLVITYSVPTEVPAVPSSVFTSFAVTRPVRVVAY